MIHMVLLVEPKAFLQLCLHGGEVRNRGTDGVKKASKVTSSMLAQMRAAMGLAAWTFSPAMMVRLVMMGLELKVSSPSAVRYCASSSSIIACSAEAAGGAPLEAAA
jgi:hypothetical protein